MNTIQDQAAAAYEAGGPEAFDGFLSANGLQVVVVTHAVTGEFFGEFVVSCADDAIAAAVKQAGYEGDAARLFAEELVAEA
jgi:hypothetical protein